MTRVTFIDVVETCNHIRIILIIAEYFKANVIYINTYYTVLILLITIQTWINPSLEIIIYNTLGKRQIPFIV